MMTGLIRLGPSGIEYLTHVWNFYSGCQHKQQGICQVKNCWAEQLVNRHKAFYPNRFEPTFYPEAFMSPLGLKKPARIGVCFMGDLFGDWVDPQRDIKIEVMTAVPDEWVVTGNWNLKDTIFNVINHCPQHTFIFLTKNPRGMLAWGTFPDNCWVGFSATNREMLKTGCQAMREVQAQVKFVSIEPMLGDTWVLPSTLTLAGINWIIIGAQTKPYKPPEVSWVEFMVAAADQAGAKVFLKNNLKRIFTDTLNPFPVWAFKDSYYTDDEHPFLDLHLRQEMPNA